MEFDEAVALGPPDAFPLEVGFLEAVGAPVGVGYGKSVIGFFAGELTLACHDCLLVCFLLFWVQSLILP